MDCIHECEMTLLPVSYIELVAKDELRCAAAANVRSCRQGACILCVRNTAPTVSCSYCELQLLQLQTGGMPTSAASGVANVASWVSALAGFLEVSALPVRLAVLSSFCNIRRVLARWPPLCSSSN